MNFLTHKRVSHTLGSQFRKRAELLVFELGDVKITREQLGSIAKPFPSVIGCKRLEQVCTKQGIRTMKELWHFGPDLLASCTGVGEVTLWVAMSLLHHAGHSVPEWFDWKDEDDVVTWSTHRLHAKQKAEHEKKKPGNGKKGVAE